METRHINYKSDFVIRERFRDGTGKVVALPDGRLLKIFRPRRRLWLARLRPQARRFADNAERLHALGISVPRAADLGWLERASEVTTMGRSLPLRTMGRMDGPLETSICTWLPITSVTAGPCPL